MWTSETDSWGGILLARHSTEQKINNEQINNCISKLSVAKRGKTRDQLQKLIQAFKNNRKGPLSFSGGVKIYLEKHTLYFTNREIEQKFETLDKNIYQSLVATQIPVSAAVIKINPLLKQNKKNLLFPELIFCRDKNAHQLLGRSMNNAYKLLPRSTQYLVDHKIWFQLMSKYKKTDSNFTIEMLTLCVSDLK